jgi:hypothetical protein
LLQSLIARESWTTTEIQQLAREHKVMLSGAVEAINDWAFEALGGQLAWEDGDHWIIEHSLLMADT